jgi:hypothetical protein
MCKFYTVYYKIHDDESRFSVADEYLTPEEITQEYFDKYYRAVADITAEGLEEVYTEMQADNWSPHGEARELIKSLGLSHTSMSMGDVAFCHNEDKYYWCAWAGFDEVALI